MPKWDMEIDREWEKFSGGPFVPYSDRVYVTLSNRGKLHINRKTFELIGKPKRMYFNRKKDMIGIRPAHDRLAEAFPVRVNGTSFYCHVGSFLRHIGIKLTTTEKFIAPDINDQGLLTLNLSQTITVGGYKRKHRRS